MTSSPVCTFVDRKGALWAGSDIAISRFDPQSDRFDVPDRLCARQPVYHVIAEILMEPCGSPAGRADSSVSIPPPVSSRYLLRSRRERHQQRLGQYGPRRSRGISGRAPRRGLNRLDPRTGEFALFSEMKGLSNSGDRNPEDREGTSGSPPTTD
jgi:hypothetical protein